MSGFQSDEPQLALSDGCLLREKKREIFVFVRSCLASCATRGMTGRDARRCCTRDIVQRRRHRFTGDRSLVYLNRMHNLAVNDDDNNPHEN